MSECECTYSLPEHSCPLERMQLKSSHSQYWPHTFPKSFEWQLHWPHTQSPRPLQIAVSEDCLQLTVSVSLKSASVHSHCGPRRPGSHRHTPHSSVPLPLWQAGLASWAESWHEQLHAKSTVTCSVSLKPKGLMLNVWLFTLGQPRSFASTLNET